MYIDSLLNGPTCIALSILAKCVVVHKQHSSRTTVIPIVDLNLSTGIHIG